MFVSMVHHQALCAESGAAYVLQGMGKSGGWYCYKIACKLHGSAVLIFSYLRDILSMRADIEWDLSLLIFYKAAACPSLSRVKVTVIAGHQNHLCGFFMVTVQSRARIGTPILGNSALTSSSVRLNFSAICLISLSRSSSVISFRSSSMNSCLPTPGKLPHLGIGVTMATVVRPSTFWNSAARSGSWIVASKSSVSSPPQL